MWNPSISSVGFKWSFLQFYFTCIYPHFFPFYIFSFFGCSCPDDYSFCIISSLFPIHPILPTWMVSGIPTGAISHLGLSAIFFFFLIYSGQNKLKVVRWIPYISAFLILPLKCVPDFFFPLLLIPFIFLCYVSLCSLKRRLACGFLESSFNLYKIITDALSCNFYYELGISLKFSIYYTLYVITFWSFL